MPELPEVETVCRQLEPEIEGRTVERLEVLDPRWCRPLPPAQLEREVSGSRIEGLGRRGKYLLLRLDRGRTLVMHLRMTGNLILVEPGGAAIERLKTCRERDHWPTGYEDIRVFDWI